MAGGNQALKADPRLRAGIAWSRDAALVWTGLLLAGIGGWAYWPTLVDMVSTWSRVPDYSHGFLVPPAAAFFLWYRREQFPGVADRFSWGGLVVMVLSIGVRAFGARFFLGSVDGWSILVWLVGATWFLGGWRLCRWALPSIAFLFFAVPLPFRVEHALRYPLQRVATLLSCWILQMFGQPALSGVNTLYIGKIELGIADACSGLRIFMSICALAGAFLLLFRRTWWERAILVVSVVPIALAANATRIVVTGLLFQWVSGEAARKFGHDVAGYAMIVYAFALFGFVLWYLGKLFPEVELVDVGVAMRDRRKELGADGEGRL